MQAVKMPTVDPAVRIEPMKAADAARPLHRGRSADAAVHRADQSPRSPEKAHTALHNGRGRASADTSTRLHRCRPALALHLCHSVTGCASTGAVPGLFHVPRTISSEHPQPFQQCRVPPNASALVGTAMSLRGAPYRDGGTSLRASTAAASSPTCSRSRVSSVPRTVSEQYQVGAGVGRSGVEPGDLVFFSTDVSGAVPRRYSGLGVRVRPRPKLHGGCARRVTDGALLGFTVPWGAAPALTTFRSSQGTKRGQIGPSWTKRPHRICLQTGPHPIRLMPVSPCKH